MYRILIVEDDDVIASAVKKHLGSWGYEVCVVADFKAVTAEFERFAPQLVLLDIALPFFNGYHWAQEIRKLSKAPIIFISSASDNMNVIMAMNLGGDDFIPKPFDLDVLTAKVGALLRRTYDFTAQAGVIEVRGAQLNTNDMTLSYGGEHLLPTRNEYRILQVLMENHGKVVSRETLMERLWETDEFIDDNTLTVNVARLRKKLEELGLSDFIMTKKGTGYLVE